MFSAAVVVVVALGTIAGPVVASSSLGWSTLGLPWLVAGSLTLHRSGRSGPGQRTSQPGRASEPSDTALCEEIAELANARGLVPPLVEQTDRLEVTAGLVERPDGWTLVLGRGVGALEPTVRQWLLVHELTHLARRDGERRRLLVASGSTWAIGASLAVAEWPLVLRSATLTIVTIVIGLALRWRWRVQERRADVVATCAVPLDPGRLRPIVAGTATVLEPGVLTSLVATHPSPASRLETVARARPSRARP